MRLDINLLFLLCVITVTTHAQELRPPSLNIGDQAPPLRLRGWLKGTPVERLEKGRLYVVEFWATWCAPCRSAMPHLSALARKYRNALTVLSIDVMEKKTTPFEKIKAFVDSMGDLMDYAVAAEQGYLMQTGWLNAAETQGIPTCFIINAEGKIAWIGHPMLLEEVLPEILNNTWDIKAALARRNLHRRLAKLDSEAYYELIRFRHDPYKPQELRDPDSVLLIINEIVKKEPGLKYTPTIAFQTFVALLKTDPQKAYEYGKVVLVTPTYTEPAWPQIRAAVKMYADKLNLPAQIYRLGAEAYRAEIDHIAFPENVDLYKYYNNMAILYWRANDTLKAIDAQQKAIADMKNRKSYSSATLAEYEAKLQQYKSK
ncbi:MAG: TlpA disulfide reductase family protein [Chitinophagaceae bacterium]